MQQMKREDALAFGVRGLDLACQPAGEVRAPAGVGPEVLRRVVEDDVLQRAYVPLGDVQDRIVFAAPRTRLKEVGDDDLEVERVVPTADARHDNHGLVMPGQ